MSTTRQAYPFLPRTMTSPSFNPLRLKGVSPAKIPSPRTPPNPPSLPDFLIQPAPFLKSIGHLTIPVRAPTLPRRRKEIFPEILATSRQIHFEAPAVLYGCNLFDFDCFPTWTSHSYYPTISDWDPSVNQHRSTACDCDYNSNPTSNTSNLSIPYAGSCAVSDPLPSFFPTRHLKLIKKIIITVSMIRYSSRHVTALDAND